MNATAGALRASFPPASPAKRHKRMADAIRMLAVDAVDRAKSGHPGAPMGMAEMAVALWDGHLKHNPSNPKWADRDRFVLSNGHASMLLYSLLHLTGYALPIGELQAFRQLHSLTPGHPEVGLTPGVETTTGPLGQGLANAVGMALAEKLLGDEFNRPGHTIVDHRTWVFCGDGCLMEGISHEACSMAGALNLNKLTVLYDDNGISIDGPVTPWFADDTPARFRAYGWNVIANVDGHDVDALDAAIAAAKASAAPTLICCKTTIGKGSPNRAGTAKAHGEPFGAAETAATRAVLGWGHEPFDVPATVYDDWSARERGADAEGSWRARWAAYRKLFPSEALEFERRMAGDLPPGFRAEALLLMSRFVRPTDPVATRQASQNVLGALAPLLPELVGGSADLTGSNLTGFPNCGAVRAGRPGGRHVNHGVREFGMAAAMNGMALHGGVIPYGGTFLTFSDYSRNAIRMAALMKLRVVHVFTHDSIGLGEDGPTHQPVEHAASLRLIPNLDVWRPCDAAETAAAWLTAVTLRDRPSALLLSRQNLPQQPRTPEQALAMQRGGYVLSDREQPVATLIATGSEVALAVAAQKLLDTQGLPVRIVSMPCTSLFERQERRYRASVLPTRGPRIAVEAGVTRLWASFGCRAVLGIDSFGESAPAPALLQHFGFTAERLADLVRAAVEEDSADATTTVWNEAPKVTSFAEIADPMIEPANKPPARPDSDNPSGRHPWP
jgi:transketolase